MVFQKILPATGAKWADPREPWPESIRIVLESAGIKRLYRHQATAIDFIRNRRHVIVATPTASGKTLVYDLSVLEHFLSEPDATALYIFPLKALAQDQLQTFETLSSYLKPSRPTGAIYDGDTSAYPTQTHPAGSTQRGHHQSGDAASVIAGPPPQMGAFSVQVTYGGR